MDHQNGSVGVVEKQCFELERYTTVGGQLIPRLRVGYETYGTLAPGADNVVLVAHHFSGNSHCAGYYSEGDPVPGYWDAIIGPGKAIDTDRYFVISCDTLVNLNVADPNTITTGPASLDPSRGRPYAMRFPVVTVADFVRVQKALLESLGIERLVAAIGPSAGAMQALQWGVDYPEWVGRVICAIGPGLSTPAYSIAQFGTWCAYIRQDPSWRNGDYYEEGPPLAGMSNALALLTLNALHFDGIERAFAGRRADPDRDPATSWDARFRVQEHIEQIGSARASAIDANSFLYMVKGLQQFSVRERLAELRAPVLFLPAASDLLYPPQLSHAAAEQLGALGKQAEVFVIEGDGGHLDGLGRIEQAAAPIERFLREGLST